jgi:hypothetical protein
MVKIQMTSGLVAQPAPTHCHSRRSWVRPSRTPTKILHHEGVPRGTIPLVHKHATCENRIGPPLVPNHHAMSAPLPHHHLPRVSMVPCHISTFTQLAIHITLPRVSRVTLPRVSAICTVSSTDCTVSKNFACLEKWREPDISRIRICLNPFKLHWDREDEAYARVCFQAITSTLIFEHILIP